MQHDTTEGKNPEVRADDRVCWITPEWLEDHLRERDMVILDTRQNSHAYFAGHIPGALWLHEAHLRCHTGNTPVRWIAPDAAEFLFSSLGIEPDRPVVVYSEGAPSGGDGQEQYLVAYTLARFGCRRVMVLDGGLNRWRDENRPVAREFGVARMSGFRAEILPGFFISREECTRMKDHPDTVLLDTRPPAWYEGQGPWMRPGHIPGAVNLPATLLLDPNNPARIRPEAELREILASREITPEKTIICSCGTGRTATAVFLVLRFFLGYPEVVLYEGGFTEWSAVPENQIVIGTLPK
jgi:thiosulfate/3-mercaptopyruvate sulfurtransferase